MIYHIVTNSNTALAIRRIKDELIDTLDFRNKLEIAISGLLIVIGPKIATNLDSRPFLFT